MITCEQSVDSLSEVGEFGTVADVHICMFGGMPKTSEWLAKARRLAAETRPAALGSAGS